MSLEWAAGGSGFIVSSSFMLGGQVYYVDLEGQMELICTQKTSWRRSPWCYPSPNGRFLAMSGWTGDGNVWLLENF
jgi:hypothetical protein